MPRKKGSIADALRLRYLEISDAQDRISQIAKAAGLPPSPTVVVTVTREQVQGLRRHRTLSTDDIIY